MSEIKINYETFDKAISKIKDLKNQCSTIDCNITVSSTGACAELLKKQSESNGNLLQIKTAMLDLLNKTEKLLDNSKKEFKSKDENVGTKINGR